MSRKLSLVTQVGIVSAVFFIIFAALLSKIVSDIVTRDFQEQKKQSISTFLEKQVDNFLYPENFQHKLRTDDDIKSEHLIFGPFIRSIRTDEIIKIRIWDDQATIIHSHTGTPGAIDFDDINKSFPDNKEYQAAMRGLVTTQISGQEAEDAGLSGYKKFMEVYVPVYLVGRETPVGVVEVYYDLISLNQNITNVNKKIFAFTGGVFIILYMALLAITKKASDTIISQNKKIKEGQQKEIEKSNELNEVLRLLNKILRHDILNDLTVVAGNIDTYFDYGKEKVDVDQVLKDAKDSIKRGVEFVKKMKELESALASGRPLGIVNVNETVKEVVKDFPKTNITISGDAKIMADGAFSSVIQNLIRNAILHGVASKIEILIAVKNNAVEIRVTDNGKGIPNEIKGKLFQEGFKYGETGNTGLGLYIVKKTIERYGGSVSIEDNKPKGAVFVLKLPNP